MGNLVDKINSIEEKIAKLLQERDTLHEANHDLKAQLKTQQTKMKTLQDKIETLKNENQTIKTANALLGSDEFKRETKFKINSLIREIDQCIVQLSE